MIGMAEQNGSVVYVYDTNGMLLWSKSGTLHGYTSTTVTIKQESIMYVFGEQGEVKFFR